MLKDPEEGQALKKDILGILFSSHLAGKAEDRYGVKEHQIKHFYYEI